MAGASAIASTVAGFQANTARENQATRPENYLPVSLRGLDVLAICFAPLLAVAQMPFVTNTDPLPKAENIGCEALDSGFINTAIC